MSSESKYSQEEDLPTVEDLLLQKSELSRPDVVFNAKDHIALIDKFLLLCEEEASDRVIAPAMEMCNFLRTRTAKANAATLRLSKLHYYRGEYLESRRLLEDCKADMEGDRNFTEEVLAFQEILDNRIQRDGKIGLMILSGLVAIGGLFYMYKRKDAAKEPKQ